MKRCNDFDNIAPYYDLLGRIVFGRSIFESQLQYLSRIPSGSRILILGGGTGRILPILLEKDPVIVTYLEPSLKMLERARTISPSKIPVNFVLGSFECLKVNEVYDVIITPFVLDIFSMSELTHCMEKLTSVLSEQGSWFFIDFQLSSSFNRYWQEPLINLMYRFFRLTCNIDADRLLDFGKLFEANRLLPIESTSFFGGVIVSRIYRFGGMSRFQ